MILPHKTGYGVLSTYSELNLVNIGMHSRLFGDLEGLGYAPVEDHDSWVVPGISFADLIGLARRYGQSTVIYCPPGGTPHTLGVGGVPLLPSSVRHLTLFDHR